jgi:hypothetical protein
MDPRDPRDRDAEHTSAGDAATKEEQLRERMSDDPRAPGTTGDVDAPATRHHAAERAAERAAEHESEYVSEYVSEDATELREDRAERIEPR